MKMKTSTHIPIGVYRRSKNDPKLQRFNDVIQIVESSKNRMGWDGMR